MIKLLPKAAIAIIVSGFFIPACRSAVAEAADDTALTQATHDLCHVQIAMLGESATHGDGHTEAFKVALVQRLVNECRFDSVFFEASHYEFINLTASIRRGDTVSADQVLTAIGGLWKFDRGFKPLAPFLLEKARAGVISLGGIDDQLGQLGQDFSNVQMVSHLTTFLPERQRQECAQTLHRRIDSDYAEATPYAPSDRTQITTCLSDIKHAVAIDKVSDQVIKEDRLEMLSAFQRWIDRDFTADAQMMMSRDRSMFQNFEWLRRRNPEHHKVILWAATVHIAKQGDPTWGDRSGTNFGSYVHSEYGTAAFPLGFSAVTGTFRKGGNNINEMPPAPPLSLEAQVLQGGSETTYIGPAQLVKYGPVPGELFRHSYQTLRWSDFLDGVVVFREEHPPSGTR